jgi:hypothetical protein
MKNFNLGSLKIRLVLLVLIATLSWASSITNEYVGYDDIKLIVRNDRIHNDILYTLQFYWNIVSDSHNVAWTNYPSVIYRPLEWTGSSIGYSLWGPKAWCFHLFVNFLFHILNTILLFFILNKIFSTPLNEAQTKLVSSELGKEFSDKKKNKKILNKNFDYAPISWWLPLIIIALWTVHPLHNEAVNMLTSGVGFLWANLFCLTAVFLNLYVKDLTSLKGISLIVFSWVLMFLGYHGSEMTIITAPMLFLIFLPSILKKDHKSYGFEIPKIIFAFSSFLAYSSHRSQIVTEHTEWIARSSELVERVFVLAPQIFFHYIRLFFWPAKLSIDEQHSVILENAFKPFHIMCFLIALIFIAAIFYFLFEKNPKYKLHNYLISASLFFTGFSIAIALNILPIYCLARDRYTYYFCLGLFCAIALIMDKYIFSGWRDLEPEKQKQKFKPFISLFLVFLVALTIRSAVKSLDWSNGERFWVQTMNSSNDIGTQQNWRYRLLQYYLDTGTNTFKPNPLIKAQAERDFAEFPFKYRLFETNTLNYYLQQANDPEQYLKNKYSYIGNKSIASALFFNATEAIEQGNGQAAMNFFKLAHMYYKEHFQTNLQLYIHTYGRDQNFTDYILNLLKQEAINNSFLAKGMMDGMFFTKDPRCYEYALLFRSRFPNTQVFTVYAFHGATFTGHYDDAYKFAKEIVKKYHEDEVFDQYIRQYEMGRFRG